MIGACRQAQEFRNLDITQTATHFASKYSIYRNQTLSPTVGPTAFAQAPSPPPILPTKQSHVTGPAASIEPLTSHFNDF